MFFVTHAQPKLAVGVRLVTTGHRTKWGSVDLIGVLLGLYRLCRNAEMVIGGSKREIHLRRAFKAFINEGAKGAKWGGV